jgi:hypothetical protein
MRGPACIFWANLTPASLEGAAPVLIGTTVAVFVQNFAPITQVALGVKVIPTPPCVSH